jgi:hypothetical protein
MFSSNYFALLPCSCTHKRLEKYVYIRVRSCVHGEASKYKSSTNSVSASAQQTYDIIFTMAQMSYDIFPQATLTVEFCGLQVATSSKRCRIANFEFKLQRQYRKLGVLVFVINEYFLTKFKSGCWLFCALIV